MQKKRPTLSLIFAGAAAAAATAASAAAFGPGGSGAAVLGQALDFTVQLRLDPGESISPDCVSAEVTIGERRLAAGAVRTGVEQLGAELARLRVRTTQVVDEPVVGIDITAGCNARLSRRFVVLADPPLNAPPAVTVAVTAAYAANLPDATIGAAAGNSGLLAPGADVPRVAEPMPATVPPAAAAPGDAGAAAVQQAPRPRAVANAPASRASARSDRRPVEVRSGERRVADRTPAARVAAESGAAPTPARADVPSPRRAPPAATVSAPTAPSAPSAPAMPPPVVVAQPAVQPPSQAVPRLKLDVAEPAGAAAVANADAAVIEQALAAVAQATSATRASASAAAASAERIAALERTVEQLRTDASTNRELAMQRDRAGRPDGAAGRWLWLLLASVLLLAAMVAWLAWRLWAMQRDRQTGWRGATGANSRVDMQLYDPPSGRQPTAPIPFMTSRIKAGDSEVMSPRGPPAWPPAVAPGPWQSTAAPASVHNIGDTIQMAPHEMAAAVEFTRADSPVQRTDVLPSLLGPDDGAPRDVSIEELIDLEQQAEFFVVLGQDDAAADLLVEHLRHTGGGSPLPYLKLLEIYRRRGDRTDYERMRERFNHRFNAYAPDWDADLQGGRTLEDYPGVIPRLQQVWTRPLDAMAELEALLFRKSRGELFDLPAYRDVLFLYSLARDLLDREAADTGNVDLLLPMADGTEFSSTSPAPYLSQETDSRFEPLQFEDLPTAPVDFDLTAETDRQTSIFDPLDDTPQGPRSRR